MPERFQPPVTMPNTLQNPPASTLVQTGLAKGLLLEEVEAIAVTE